MAKSSEGSGQKVITPKARAVYAFVFKPRPSQKEGGEPKYSVTLVFPKTTDLSKLKAAAQAAAQNKWGDRYKKMKLDSPFHNGNEERVNDDGEVDPVFKNSTFLTARSTQQPGIVDENADAIMDQSEFYSGCYCRASLYAFAYDNSGKKGVSFLLNNIQKLADGEKLTNRLSAEEEFGAADEDSGSRKSKKPATKGKSRSTEDDDDPFEE